MTLGSHQKTVGDTQTWITPRWLIDELGPFDLDPAGAYPRPWHCANQTFTRDGLTRAWEGRVWLNPPFNRYEVGQWVQKLANHGRGTALLHARTEAEWFGPVWRAAKSMLFLADRLYFHYPDGRRAEANSGAPAVLIAFGVDDHVRLRDSDIQGALVTQWVVR